MNFILTLFICSYTTGTCLPPYTWHETYKDGYSCMISGNEKSILKLKEIGKDDVNNHKIFIKFQCQQTEVGEAT